jgi:IS30 family transposase
MPLHYEQISRVEREKIAIGMRQGWSCRRVGREIGRPGSTVWREVKRNGAASGFYGSRQAHVRALERRCKARRQRKLSYRPLRLLVERCLRSRWSPDQISGRHELTMSGQEQMQVSDNTIYRHIHGDRERYQPYLRGPSPARHRSKQRERIHGRKMIEERPEEVEERIRPGDYESDTIRGPMKSDACVVTHVDRTTYYLVARLLKERSAQALNEATRRSLQGLPAHTLTVDNGMEFASFKRLEEMLGAQVFFAHKHKPWQRARNENSNRLLRQYFPRGTKFEDVSPAQLGRAVRSLNDRPRKALGYKTPREVMKELGVALGS